MTAAPTGTSTRIADGVCTMRTLLKRVPDCLEDEVADFAMRREPAEALDALCKTSPQLGGRQTAVASWQQRRCDGVVEPGRKIGPHVA